MPPDRDRLMRAALTRTVPDAAFSAEGLAAWMAAAAQTPSLAPAADQSSPRLAAGAFAGDGDRFAATAVLGAGATGQVWSMHDRDLDRTIAVKVLADEGDGDGVRAFIDEARITASLSHPNVLPVHDLGRDTAGRAFFSMKRIDGRSLADAIEASSAAARLPPLADPNAVAVVFIAVCQALAYAHHRRVVHQDVKPANIMLGGFGEVLLVDWGSAVRLGGATPPRLYGTPLYMSPEQARSERVDERSDVYAVGASLFHALFLRPPTWDDDPQRFFALKRDGVVDPPDAEERRGVPAALTGIALKAMAPRAEDRYRDAEALLADLRAYQGGLAVTAHRDSALERLARWHRRHAKVLWPTAAAAAALLALGAALYGERLARIARWGSPIVAESFDDDGYRSRWTPYSGAFERRDGRLVSSDRLGSVLLLDRKLWGAVAIEYDAEILPGSLPCDLSAVWCRDVVHAEGGAKIERMVDAYWFQFGANDGAYSSISLNASRQLAVSYVRPEPGRVHHVRCEIVDDRLSLAVDGRPLCEWIDPFRFDGGYVGLYAFYPGKAFDNLRVSVRGVPRTVPATAIGDALWRDGQFALAERQYARVAESWAGDALGEEALFKRGFCLWRLDRRDEADAAWAPLRDGRYEGLVRLQQLDRRFEAGDHAAVAAELSALCAGASAALRQRLAMRWSAWTTDRIDHRDLAAVGHYLALHDRALADLSVCDGTAAEALAALGRDAEIVERFPGQRMLCANALIRLHRWRDVVERYPDQIWPAAQALVELGDYDRPEIAMHGQLVSRIRLRGGRCEQALASGAMFNDDAVEALCALGRLDEALARAGSDARYRAWALIPLGRAREVIDHPPEGETDRDEGVALADLALGDLGGAYEHGSTWTGSRSLAACALAVEAWAAGDRAEAERRFAEPATCFEAAFGARLLAPFLRALDDGRWDGFDAACRAAVDAQADYTQRLSWCARRLLGAVDDAGFLAQPYRLGADARLVVLQAMAAERRGDRAAAAASWRAWLELPRWRRGVLPDPALEAVAARRIAALAH